MLKLGFSKDNIIEVENGDDGKSVSASVHVVQVQFPS